VDERALDTRHSGQRVGEHRQRPIGHGEQVGQWSAERRVGSGSEQTDVAEATVGEQPQVPSILDHAGDVRSDYFILSAPAGTPTAAIDKVNAAVNDFLKGPRGREIHASLGLEVIGGSPADMRKFLDDEAARLEPVIKAAKIVIE